MHNNENKLHHSHILKECKIEIIALDNIPAMKQITKSLSDFILAFDLVSPITGVCFDAMVFFYTETLALQIESEIHIITIFAKQVDVIYILNPEISKKGFPDMFESEHCEIDFKKRKGLLLKDTTAENKSYSILIQPTGKNCQPATLKTFRGK